MDSYQVFISIESIMKKYTGNRSTAGHAINYDKFMNEIIKIVIEYLNKKY